MEILVSPISMTHIMIIRGFPQLTITSHNKCNFSFLVATKRLYRPCRAIGLSIITFLFRAQREMKRGSVRPRIHPFVPESMELASVVDDETGA